MNTEHLGLHLLPSNEFDAKKYYEYIEELSGDGSTSNMQLIDAAIAGLDLAVSSIETQLSAI